MNERRRTLWSLLVIAVLAIAGGLACAHWSDPLSYEERLLRAGLADTLGSDARELYGESPELQALMLDYSLTPELIHKSRFAIAKYGDDARVVLSRYGESPELQQILRRYGEGVVPVVAYFVDNDPPSVRVLAKLTRAGRGDWGADERGWYAVESIASGGHDFLGQFAVGSDGKARWIQSERFAEAASSLFGSGVITLERKHALDETIEAADVFWAGVDAAVVFSTVKALRALRFGGTAVTGAAVGARTGAVGAGRGTSLLERTRLLGVRLVPGGAVGRAIVKSGAAALIVYVVVRHPSVLNGVFDQIAAMLGWNPFAVKAIAWTLLIGAALAVVTALARPLIAVLVFVTSVLLRALRRFERLVHP
jgi:hypothetical protein